MTGKVRKPRKFRSEMAQRVAENEFRQFWRPRARNGNLAMGSTASSHLFGARPTIRPVNSPVIHTVHGAPNLRTKWIDFMGNVRRD